jgi:hypothetical protein
MKNLSLLIVFALVAGAFTGNAQSLKNTAWKTYISGLNDSITLHIGNDTSFVTMGTGDVVVRSVCHVSKDTLTMQDFDGQYMCASGMGTYVIALKEDKLTMKMVTDPCTDRSGSIDGATWVRVKMDKK